MKTCQAGT